MEQRLKILHAFVVFKGCMSGIKTSGLRNMLITDSILIKKAHVKMNLFFTFYIRARLN